MIPVSGSRHDEAEKSPDLAEKLQNLTEHGSSNLTEKFSNFSG